TATFAPAGNLTPLTTYTATISTGARDLAGNALPGDFVWSFTTGVIPDTTAPTVSDTVPPNATTRVGITPQLATTFSEPMDASTINSITVTPNPVISPLSLHDTLPILTATFAPAGNLTPLTTYTATISTGAKDLAGNALNTDMSWSFTTGVAPDTTA